MISCVLVPLKQFRTSTQLRGLLSSSKSVHPCLFRGIATHERYVFCDVEPTSTSVSPRVGPRPELVQIQELRTLVGDPASTEWRSRISVDATSGELLVDGKRPQQSGEPSSSSGPSLRARAIVHAALRGRPGYISAEPSASVWPVVHRSRQTYPTATNVSSLRAVQAPDRVSVLRVRVEDLQLPLQVKRRLLALAKDQIQQGVLELHCDSREDAAYNERRARSILTRLVNEAYKATQGPEQWVSSVVRLPLPTHEDHLAMLEETWASEEAKAQELLAKWCELKSHSPVPVYADKLYEAYPKALVEEKVEVAKQVNVDDQGFTVL